jgi:hypothetical protein
MPTPASELNNGEWVLPKSNRSKTSDNNLTPSTSANYGVSTRRSTKNKETFQAKNGDDSSNSSSTTLTSLSEEHAHSVVPKKEIIFIKEKSLDVPDIEESSVPVSETSSASDTENGDLVIDLNPVVKEEEDKPDQQSSIEIIEIDNITVTTRESGGEEEEESAPAGPSSEPSTGDDNNSSFQCEQCFKVIFILFYEKVNFIYLFSFSSSSFQPRLD